VSWADRGYAAPRFDSPFRRSPFAAWTIAVTVAAHLAKVIANATTTGAGSAWNRVLGVTWEGVLDLELWRLATYALVHGDAMHLFWNMLGLGVFGSMIEPIFGPRRMLRIYAAGAVVGGLGVAVHALARVPDAPMIGASGALYAIMVAAAFTVPNAEIIVFILRVKVKWLVTIYAVIDVLTLMGDGRRAFGETGGIGASAHLLGGLAGAVAAYVWPRLVAPRVDALRAARAQRRAAAAEPDADDLELDRLLEKIQRDGLPSLSDAERAFLRRASSRRRDGR